MKIVCYTIDEKFYHDNKIGSMTYHMIIVHIRYISLYNVRASTLLAHAFTSPVLDSTITSTNDEESFPHLCHSCHVVRPLRSKHCKLLRRCIQRVSYKYYILVVFLLLCIRTVHTYHIYFFHDIFISGEKNSANDFLLGEEGSDH